MLSGRQYAVARDGTKITFECARAAHQYTMDLGKKSLPVSRRLGESGARMMASWWSRAKGGCIGVCPKCLREEKKQKDV